MPYVLRIALCLVATASCGLACLATAKDSAAAPPIEAQRPTQAESDSATKLSETADIDFVTDVRPIFARHCYQCHGPLHDKGGLRLHTRQFAQAGGHSGIALLGGDLDSNEILSRVLSNDPNYRMPRDTERLSDDELAILERWVAEGTNWPDDLKFEQNPLLESADSEFSPPPLWVLILSADWIDSLFTFASAIPHLFGLSATCLCVLIVLAIAQRYERELQKKNRTPPSWLGKAAAGIGRRSGLLLILTTVTLGLLGRIFVLDKQVALIPILESRVSELNTQVAELSGKTLSTTDLYGNPPLPVRMTHPRRTEHTYYRGNNERDPKLFNQGNYATAIFEISLIGPNRETLVPGNEFPSGNAASVNIQIRRAPNATKELFKPEIFNRVLVSETYDRSKAEEDSNSLTFKTIEPFEAFEVAYPISQHEELDDCDLSGVIYIYTGNRPAFAASYRLKVDSGIVSDESEIWMNHLYAAAFLPPPIEEGKIPHSEWFDWRPLPIIDAPQTEDEDLLGITEHYGDM
ncbi:c-type cytochrome domain-containing protein [Stratiformator vulcanicus]|uniref:Planctomycete cytochrome C n=1 Tax=Stratiformator vulcanicus TaxID=2527980 RepID=A0A517QW03_9PLAN|nr:c-type cytochrome domain-containing protein [Stratiformator vulcanicus]QDT35836.1 Planctomycete cytochrome C [Stratiformator vulcanicus]